MRALLSAAIIALWTAVAFAQANPQSGSNSSGLGNFIVSTSCAAQPQISGAPLCYDSIVGQLFSFGGATYSVPTTGSAAAGGTPGSGQYNLAGVLAGLSGTGIFKLNGSSPPTIAVPGTDFQAPLTSGAPASTTIGGSGLTAPGNGFLFAQGASPFGLLTLGTNQVIAGPSSAPIALSLAGCPSDGQHAWTFPPTGPNANTIQCVTVTASVIAPGTTGSTVWTNAGTLAAFTGTGVLKLNGTSSPSIAVPGTDFAAAVPGASNVPLLSNGIGGFNLGSLSGSTTVLGTINGALTSGHVIKADASSNLIDGGPAAAPAEINLCTITGTTAGTAQFYEEIAGHDIRVVAVLNAYQNSTNFAQVCPLTSNGGSTWVTYGNIMPGGNVSPFAAGVTGAPPNTITLPINMSAPETGVLIAEGL